MEHLEGRAQGYARCVFDPEHTFSPVTLLIHKDGRDNVRPLVGTPSSPNMDLAEHANVYEAESAIWVVYNSERVCRKWRAQVTYDGVIRRLGRFEPA